MSGHRSRRGFTVAELLAAAGLLAAASAACFLALTASVRSSAGGIFASRAGLMASAVSEAVRDELRFCGGLEITESGIIYDSAVYGENALMTLKGGRAAVYSGGREYFLPVGEYGGLKVGQMSFEERSGAVEVKLVICTSGGRPLRECRFEVKRVNEGQ